MSNATRQAVSEGKSVPIVANKRFQSRVDLVCAAE